jgi:hypothetical protein
MWAAWDRRWRLCDREQSIHLLPGRGYFECSLCGAQFPLNLKNKEESIETFRLHLKVSQSLKTNEDRYYTCEIIPLDDVDSSWKYEVCGYKHGQLPFETLHEDDVSRDQECRVLESQGFVKIEI